MAENKQQQQLKEITERLEKGVQELFSSEKYMEYLRVMSQFHNYSFSNTLLIAMQKPDATWVAGYGAWQKKFERNVMKGEKAIKIFAPAPRKVEVERDVLDPDTRRPILDENGEPKKETVTIQKPYFKVTSVFDVSQTDGKPLPELDTVHDLTGSIEGYSIFFEALKRTAKVPMEFEHIEGDSHGYYHQVEKRIAIAEGMSEAQNVKTAIHEIAHSRLHDVDMLEAEKGVIVDRRTREVQAESVAYTICQRYGIETSDYSFGYIAGWSEGREMQELRSSMEVIRREANSMIKEIDANLEIVRKERALQSEQEQSFIKGFYVVEDLQVQGPLVIHRFDDMDEALKTYFALPNDKAKAFGIDKRDNPLPGSLDFIQCTNGINRIVVDYLGVEGWKNPEVIAATERIDVALDLFDDQIAYRVEDMYFTIQHTEEGFDYTFYDADFHLLDGGVLDNPDYTITEAIDELLEDDDLSFEQCEVINYEDFMEQVEAVETVQIEVNRGNQPMPEFKVGDRFDFSTDNGSIQIELVEVQAETVSYVVVDAPEQHPVSMTKDDLARYLETPMMKKAPVVVDSIEALAADLDNFSFDHDVYEYRNSYDDREDGLRSVMSLLRSGDVEGIKSWLQEIVEDSEDIPEYADKVQSLIDRIDSIPREAVAEVEPKITFYVAECGEFHNMGEFHEDIETIEEALSLYDQIPAERMNAVKSIGFVLSDGSIYDGMPCDILSGEEVLHDLIDDTQHFRESSLVQKALADIQTAMDERAARKEMEQPKHEVVPLSPLSFAEAKEQGQIENWRASRRETEACAHEFQENFGMAYHERRMPEYLQEWTDKYGLDRCKIVLASTIQLASHDGRYYPSTKENAAKVVIPGADADHSRDIRFSYLVNTHPVMINAAFRELMNMEQERGQTKAKVEHDAKAPKESVLARLHDKQKEVSKAKQNPAKAQDKKRGVEID